MTPSDPRVGEIQARLDGATPGPWEAGTLGGHASDVFTVATEEDLGCWVVCEHAGSDAEFIANAPADVAYLLAQLWARDEAIAKVEALAERWAGLDNSPIARSARLRTLRAAVAAATGGGES